MTITRNAQLTSRQTRRRGPASAPIIFFALFLALHKVTLGAEAQSYSLTASPLVCVTLGGDTPCEMSLDLAWTAAAADDLCLVLLNTGTVLECWKQARQGRHTLEYTSLQNVALQLIDEEAQVLDEVEIKVVSRDLRESRRRRRHVWSIL